MNPTQTCSYCQAVTDQIANFCPHCGKPFKEQPLSTSFGKQLLIYFVSFFLTPFGMVWGIQYIRSSQPKARIIGIISIFLTILSIVLMLTTFAAVMNIYTQMLNNVGGYGGVGL
jgi:hypothetical protein